jgi:putative phage-type endonuclease
MLINHDFTVDRAKYIGGSDIGAILGLSRFKTPLQVWMQKTGKEIGSKDSLPMRFGSFAESFIADEYAKATGAVLLHDESAQIHPQHSFMAAHIDRYVLGDGENALPTKVLECKTANVFAKSEWGQVGSDEVPMSYLAQVTWYLAVTGIERADLAVLFGNSDFRIYQIERDKELENLLIEKAIHFWSEHILKDIPPPPASEVDYQTLFSKGNSALRVEANREEFELVKKLHLLNDQVTHYEEEVSGIKQRLMSAMGQAESLHYQGQLLATWKAPKPSYRLDAKRIEQENHSLYEQYQIPVQNSRRLVVKQLGGE